MPREDIATWKSNYFPKITQHLENYNAEVENSMVC